MATTRVKFFYLAVLYLMVIIAIPNNAYASNKNYDPRKEMAWSLLYAENMADTFLRTLESAGSTLEDFKQHAPETSSSFEELRRSKNFTIKDPKVFYNYSKNALDETDKASNGESLQGYFYGLYLKKRLSKKDFDNLITEPVKETDEALKNLDLDEFVKANPGIFSTSSLNAAAPKARRWRLLALRKAHRVNWYQSGGLGYPQYINPLASFSRDSALIKEEFESHIASRQLELLNKRRVTSDNLEERIHSHFRGWIKGRAALLYNYDEQNSVRTSACGRQILTGFDLKWIDNIWLHGGVGFGYKQVDNYDIYETSSDYFKTDALIKTHFEPIEPVYINMSLNYSFSDFMLDDEIFYLPIDMMVSGISIAEGVKYSLGKHASLLFEAGFTAQLSSVNNPDKNKTEAYSHLEKAIISDYQRYGGRYFDMRLAIQGNIESSYLNIRPALNIKYTRKLNSSLNKQPRPVEAKTHIYSLEDMTKLGDQNQLILSPSLEFEAGDHFSLDGEYKFSLGEYNSAHSVSISLKGKL
jgi:hypothetical protein